jgi:hypothetical protein
VVATTLAELPSCSGYFSAADDFAIIHWDEVGYPIKVQIRDASQNLVYESPFITALSFVAIHAHPAYANYSFRLVDQNGRSTVWQDFGDPPIEVILGGLRASWEVLSNVLLPIFYNAPGALTSVIFVPPKLVDCMCGTTAGQLFGCYNFQTWSPVNMKITDPDGLVLSKNKNQLGNSIYSEFDYFLVGDPIDIVYLTNPKAGQYLIEVIPQGGSSPNDTYSFYFWGLMVVHGMT